MCGVVEEEEDDEDDEDDEDGVALDGESVTDDDINAGISSVTSTAASGLATPDAINLRKTIADGVGTPSAVSTGGLDTPESSAHATPQQLYQVLEQTSSKVGSSAFGSAHGYVVPPPPPGGIGTAGGSNKVRAGRGGGGAGVDLALDPAELENLDESALKARYDSLRKAESDLNAPEDVSDIIAEQERKRKRKLDGKR